MGAEFIVKGKEAAKFIQSVTSNDVNRLEIGDAQYSCMPNDNGGIVDDLLVYRLTEDQCNEGEQAYIILDSMAEEFSTVELWGAQGNLGIDQLNKLDLILDELADNPVIERILVILHHHPFDYLFYHGLRDHADLKGVISRRIGFPPRVNVVLFGHKHLDHRFNDPGENKEELFGIDMIFASGQTVERNSNGNMIVPVIDLKEYTIQRFEVK